MTTPETLADVLRVIVVDMRALARKQRALSTPATPMVEMATLNEAWAEVIELSVLAHEAIVSAGENRAANAEADLAQLADCVCRISDEMSTVSTVADSSDVEQWARQLRELTGAAPT